MKKYLLLLLLPFALAACGTDDIIDDVEPTITVPMPAENQLYASGDTVRFKAYFEDNVKLGTISANILNTDAQTNVLNDTRISGKKIDSLAGFIVPTLTGSPDTVNFELIVYAEDSNDNFKNKTVKFRVRTQ